MLPTWSAKTNKLEEVRDMINNVISLLQKRDFETHALYIRAIDDLKWDFSEALQFLSSHTLSWPKEVSSLKNVVSTT